MEDCLLNKHLAHNVQCTTVKNIIRMIYVPKDVQIMTKSNQERLVQHVINKCISQQET